MTQTIDETRLEAFLGKVVDETGAAYNTMLVAIGDELGLYTALCPGVVQCAGRQRIPALQR